MASLSVRARQSAVAMVRLRASAQSVADRFGVIAPVIPERHKDPLYLPTLQMEAMTGFLDSLESVKPKAKAI